MQQANQTARSAEKERRARRLAWLPVAVLLAASGLVWTSAPTFPHESQALLFVLNVPFMLLTGLLVVFLMGRSFRTTGDPGLLWLGGGVFFWGCAPVVAVAACRHDVNGQITIHNLCTWLAAACHLGGGLCCLRTKRQLAQRGTWLLLVYSVAVTIVGLIIMGELGGWLPLFFVQGQGGTPLRQAVVGSAAAMFGATAWLLTAGKQRPLSAFTYWYSLALVLTALGLLGVLLQSSAGSLLNWTSRGAMVLGGMYLLIAALQSVREGGVWAASLEARERHQREFLECVINNAGACIAVIQGRELRYTIANPAFQIYGGGQTMVGRTYRELFPEAAAAGAEAGLLAVLETGEPWQVESYAAPVPGKPDAIWQGQIVRLPLIEGEEPSLLAVVWDITERKHAEEALHELSGQFLRVQDQERRRLARELHDSVAQMLAASAMSLSRLVEDGHWPDAKAREILTDTFKLVSQSAEEIRTMCHVLHPPLLEELGLAAAVRDFADGFARRSGLRVDLEIGSDLARLPKDFELALFRVLQESLSNIHRHSGSRTASITLLAAEGEVWLEVGDTGRGVPAETLLALAGEGRGGNVGIGLPGMRERLRQLGGKLEIESQPGHTVLRAVIPLKNCTA